MKLKSLVLVMFFIFVKDVSAWTPPDALCAELKKITFKSYSGNKVKLTVFVKKLHQGCKILDVQLPSYSSMKVLNVKTEKNRRGVYVEQNTQQNYTVLRVKFNPRHQELTKSFYLQITQASERVDLLASTLILKQMVNDVSNKGMFVGISGPGGWWAQLSIFEYSRNWLHYANRKCKEKVKNNNFFAKSGKLTESKVWCTKLLK